jgi:hypothetical protein
MLASQISNLAGFWLAGIADRGFATLVRIQMSQSRSTVSIIWDGRQMDMVHCGFVNRDQRQQKREILRNGPP